MDTHGIIILFQKYPRNKKIIYIEGLNTHEIKKIIYIKCLNIHSIERLSKIEIPTVCKSIWIPTVEINFTVTFKAWPIHVHKMTFSFHSPTGKTYTSCGRERENAMRGSRGDIKYKILRKMMLMMMSNIKRKMFWKMMVINTKTRLNWARKVREMILFSVLCTVYCGRGCMSLRV